MKTIQDKIKLARKALKQIQSDVVTPFPPVKQISEKKKQQKLFVLQNKLTNSLSDIFLEFVELNKDLFKEDFAEAKNKWEQFVNDSFDILNL